MKHLPQLDGLRAVAILMVFAHHAFNARLLWNGVDLFFILSGYLITNILLRDSQRMSFGQMLSRFYLRRAERILPAYLVFLLLIYICIPVDWKHLWFYYFGFLQNIPPATGMVPAGPLVPLWSLAVEQHFYLVWPILIYFLPRRWLAPCMVGLLIAAPILRAVCTPLFPAYDSYKLIYMLTPFRIDAMAAGALAALLLPDCKPRPTIRLAQIAMLVGTIVYILLAMHPGFRRTNNSVVFNSLAYSLNILILGGLFVWTVVARNTFLTRFLSNPLLRGLGRISYMFYLLHGLIVIECFLHLPHRLGAPVALVLTTFGATVSWFALEKPILTLGARYRRPPPPHLNPENLESAT